MCRHFFLNLKTVLAYVAEHCASFETKISIWQLLEDCTSQSGGNAQTSLMQKGKTLSDGQ